MADTTGPAWVAGQFYVWGDWLTVDVGSCTCAAAEFNGQVVHERGCGLEPVISLGELKEVLRRAGHTVVEISPATGITAEIRAQLVETAAAGIDVGAEYLAGMRSALDQMDAALAGRTVVDTEPLCDLLTEAHRQDFGTPGWRARVRSALAAESSGDGGQDG